MSDNQSSWQEGLTDLQQKIVYAIDTGNNRFDIIDQITYEFPEYSSEKVNESISQMEKDWLIINRGGDYYTVTAWSHEGVFELTKAETFTQGLKILASKGIYHCDMDEEGIYFNHSDKEFV